MKNIISGFRKTGILPLNRCAFSDEVFEGASVIDRANPGMQCTVDMVATSSSQASIINRDNVSADQSQCITVQASTGQASINRNSESAELFASPEEVRPSPKALTRIQKAGRRK